MICKEYHLDLNFEEINLLRDLLLWMNFKAQENDPLSNAGALKRAKMLTSIANRMEEKLQDEEKLEKYLKDAIKGKTGGVQNA